MKLILDLEDFRAVARFETGSVVSP